MAWADKREFDKAIADFSEAMKRGLLDEDIYIRRANAFREKADYDHAIADYNEAVLRPLRDGAAYVGRGNVWAEKVEYDKALADYNEAIRLDRKFALAYLNRGIVRRYLKAYDAALADFDEAIRLDPKEASPHYNRAGILFLAHRDGAVEEIKAVLDLVGWRANLSMYAALLGHLAARRAHQRGQARTLLDDLAARCDAAAWPYPIVQYLRGEIGAAGLMAAAVDNDKRTEAHCFLGLDALENGRKAAAEDHFRGVKEQGNPRFWEYAISIAELDRLRAEGAEGDGP